MIYSLQISVSYLKSLMRHKQTKRALRVQMSKLSCRQVVGDDRIDAKKIKFSLGAILVV
jgi:hypothetical protein